jgi:ADP-ribose pyrophosphatase
VRKPGEPGSLSLAEDHSSETWSDIVSLNEPRARVLAARTVYQGRIVTVTLDRVRLPHGPEVDMEVVRHRGSVVLLPMPDPKHVILVKQYRYAIDRWIWELPAGCLEPGEAPDAAAARECEEEVGLVPHRVERLASLHPTPGYCDEEMIFYRLSGLEQPPAGTTAAEKDEDESFEVRTYSAEEARALVRSGGIVDLKTAFGLTLID